MFKRMKEQREMVKRYQRLFRSADGQKVLSDLMSVCGVQRSSFSTDALTMAYHEGERAVLLRILKTVNVTENELNSWFSMKEKELDELASTEEQL